MIYDNSDGKRCLVAERMPGSELTIYDAARWSKISC